MAQNSCIGCPYWTGEKCEIPPGKDVDRIPLPHANCFSWTDYPGDYFNILEFFDHQDFTDGQKQAFRILFGDLYQLIDREDERYLDQAKELIKDVKKAINEDQDEDPDPQGSEPEIQARDHRREQARNKRSDRGL